MLREDNVIALVTENRLPHYEPYGWHHWPEHPWFIDQFRTHGVKATPWQTGPP